MKNENPNHTAESKPQANLSNEAQQTIVDNSELINQDINENFLNLKNDLIFFKDKSKLNEIKADLSEDTKYLKIKEEFTPEDLKEKGLDFCIVADVSESMFPYRIFLKKSMYFSLKDIENFCYKSIDSPDEFPNVRIAFVKYTDRTSADTPSKVEVLDFVQYTSLEEVCKKIDEIEIKNYSVKKRAVFDGLKAVCDLKWNEDSIKIISHYAADPEYGVKYTTSPKTMPDNYDPFPGGCTDLDVSEILGFINGLDVTFNLVKLDENRLLKYQSVVQEDLNMEPNGPKVTKLSS